MRFRGNWSWRGIQRRIRRGERFLRCSELGHLDLHALRSRLAHDLQKVRKHVRDQAERARAEAATDQFISLRTAHGHLALQGFGAAYHAQSIARSLVLSPLARPMQRAAEPGDRPALCNDWHQSSAIRNRARRSAPRARLPRSRDHASGKTVDGCFSNPHPRWLSHGAPVRRIQRTALTNWRLSSAAPSRRRRGQVSPSLIKAH